MLDWPREPTGGRYGPMRRNGGGGVQQVTRRWLASRAAGLLGAGGGAAGLAACVPGATEPPPTTLGPARLEAWTHLGQQGHKDALAQLTSAFTGTQPQVTVEWTHVPP